MNEAARVEETRQRVIGMVMEGRARIEEAARRVAEIRGVEDLGPAREHAALFEVTTEVRKRTTELIRDARYGARGGWTVGAGGIGLPVKPWDDGLSPQGLAARDAMLGYLEAAERVFAVDLEELEAPPGEAPTNAEAAAERDAAAAEVASYESAHSAPAAEGVAPARDRVRMSR